MCGLLKQRYFLYKSIMNLEPSRPGAAHRHTFLLGAVSLIAKTAAARSQLNTVCKQRLKKYRVRARMDTVDESV